MDPEEIEQLCASIINKIVGDIPMHSDVEENNANPDQLAAPNKPAKQQQQELLHENVTVSAKCYMSIVYSRWFQDFVMWWFFGTLCICLLPRLDHFESLLWIGMKRASSASHH